MTCPLEKKMIALLRRAELRFTRPERDIADPGNLDFYLPALDIYIEIKRFHADRINGQVQRVTKTVVVLVGPRAVEDFERLLAVLAPVAKEVNALA